MDDFDEVPPPPEEYQPWDDEELPPPPDTPVDPEAVHVPRQPVKGQAHCQPCDIGTATEDVRARFTPEALAAYGMKQLRRTIACLEGRDVESAKNVVTQILNDRDTLKLLTPQDHRTAEDLLQLLQFQYGQVEAGVVRLLRMPLRLEWSQQVQRELQVCVELARSGAIDGMTPVQEWGAVKERATRAAALASIDEFQAALLEGRGVEALNACHGKVIATPPTSLGQAAIRTARPNNFAEYYAQWAAANEGVQEVRYSFGLPLLDTALTNDGQVTGSIAPGEGFLIAGPTGTGKSSFIYGTLRAITIDAIAWHGPFARVVLLHTEEESIDKGRAMQICPGQAFEHLQKNIQVVNVGSSRIRVVEELYESIMKAEEKLAEYGGVITDYLPRVIYLDYIGSLTEAGESGETESSYWSAELILRAIQRWDVPEMAKWGGRDCQTYEEYSGRQAPEGMENHRVATVTMAQLVKQSDESLFYNPGPCQCAWEPEDEILARHPYSDDDAVEVLQRQRASDELAAEDRQWPVTPCGEQQLRFANLKEKREFCSMKERLCAPSDRRVNQDDFVLENPEGKNSWLLRAGDLKALTKNAIRGSGAIANNATCIILLHRSRPVNNPKRDDSHNLVDTRARLILDKTRNGAKFGTVELAFDLSRGGRGAQYFDPLADSLMELDDEASRQFRKTIVDAHWRQPGDPILPIRPKRSHLEAIRY